MGDWKPLLRGIGFVGYRSFASDWEPIDLSSKVTVIAGINNSGKSNVLSYLQNVLPRVKPEGPTGAPSLPAIEGLDRPSGYPNMTSHRVAIPITAGSLSDTDRRLLQRGGNPQTLDEWRLLAMRILAVDGEYWSVFEGNGTRGAVPRDRVETAINFWPGWQQGYRTVLNMMGGGSVDADDVMARLLASVGGFENLPPVRTIVASRRVELTGVEAVTGMADAGSPDSVDWLSGRGIIEALARLQNPEFGVWQESRERWDSVNQFVQIILDDPHARINIPHDARTIQVETPQRVLPLANLGSGIEQVIILAAAATVLKGTLVCIEEPETNLHPILQKKLTRYLTDKTDNQYVIATHSSHFLDDSRATAYHLRLTDTGTQAQMARKPHELVAICNDLGYRPSDLMQTNCVLWVEGPSDRVYIRRWLELSDPVLAEGIDYSLMFYGGKLLAHLTVDEEALQDFVDLRRLNRASAVVIDSDRTGPHKHIGATKKRIKAEFDSNAKAIGMTWVTRGYTIENYIPRDVLQEAVSEVHPGKSLTGTNAQWDNPLATVDSKSFDKIAIARAVEKRLELTHLDRLDLRTKLTEVSHFIRSANGHL